MPAPEFNGFIKTLNQMGFMTSSLDPYSQAFVQYAAQNCSSPSSAPVLEIGAAYGVATLGALEKGAKIIANDLDPRHLEILSKRAEGIHNSSLVLAAGNFPETLDFPPESIGAVLICRVIHFFDGLTIEKAADKLFHWLIPGGKIFVVGETPYLKNCQAFVPIYESRKQAGDLWPGYVEDMKTIASGRAESLPQAFHFLDPDILIRIFINVGFAIEKCGMFARPDFPADLKWDGRESVGLIAKK